VAWTTDDAYGEPSGAMLGMKRVEEMVEVKLVGDNHHYTKYGDL